MYNSATVLKLMKKISWNHSLTDQFINNQLDIFLFPFTDISEPHHAQAQLSDNHQHQNQETEVTIETRGIILNELPTTTNNVAQ